MRERITGLRTVLGRALVDALPEQGFDTLLD